MRRTTIALVLVLVALAGSIALVALRDPRSPAALPVPGAAGQVATAAPAVEASAERTPAPRVTAPDDHGFAVTTGTRPVLFEARLFDAETPLAARIDELDRRARGGDAAAGCQLGFELLRCEKARQMAGYHENVEAQARMLSSRNLSPAQVQERIDSLLAQQQRNRLTRQQCEGVQTRDWAEPARYLQAAAERGHRHAMRMFLEDDLYRSDALFRDPGLVALLRTHGPRYFRRLIESGDPYMLDRVRAAQHQTGDMLFEVLPPPWNSPELASEILRARSQANGFPGEPREGEADPALVAEAARLYDAWFRPNEAEWMREGQVAAQVRGGDASLYGCAELAGSSSRR